MCLINHLIWYALYALLSQLMSYQGTSRPYIEPDVLCSISIRALYDEVYHCHSIQKSSDLRNRVDLD